MGCHSHGALATIASISLVRNVTIRDTDFASMSTDPLSKCSAVEPAGDAEPVPLRTVQRHACARRRRTHRWSRALNTHGALPVPHV